MTIASIERRTIYDIDSTPSVGGNQSEFGSKAHAGLVQFVVTCVTATPVIFPSLVDQGLRNGEVLQSGDGAAA